MLKLKANRIIKKLNSRSLVCFTQWYDLAFLTLLLLSSTTEQISNRLSIMGAKFLSVREGSFNMEKEERDTKFCVVGLELQVSV